MASQAISKTFHQEVWREVTLHKQEQTRTPKSSRLLRRLKNAVKVTPQRCVYLWFLALSVLECLSPARDYRLLIPFLALLVVEGFKTAAGCHSHREHCQSNGLYTVWRDGDLTDVEGKELRIGNIVCLKNDDEVPADMVILASGRSDHCCLVDIFPFVGTPRVQSKSSVRETQRIIKSKELNEAYQRLSKLQGTVKVIQPSIRVDLFRGLVKLKGYPVAARLSLDNLMLKESRVITTPWVFGLVVYAGKDCKSELVAHSTHIDKQPSSTRLVTKLYLVLITAVCMLAIMNALLARYLVPDSNAQFWFQFLWFLLLYGQSVPASTYLLLEVIRGVQTYLLHLELNTGLFRVPFKSSHAVETLGSVSHVFLDKAGTLTTNQLRSKIVLINRSDYTRCELSEDMHRTVCVDNCVKTGNDGVAQTRRWVNFQLESTDHTIPEQVCGFTELSTLMRNKDSTHFRFCEALVLCSSLHMNASGEVVCSSKYDEALYRTSKDLGVALIEKSANTCHFQVGDAEFRYTTVAVMDFKPQVQRMRILVQKQGSSEGLFLLKGTADVMRKMFQLTEEDQQHIGNYLDELSKRSMKIVVYAGRTVRKEEMEEMEELLETAKMANNLHRKEEHIFRELEKNCELISIVGLEDPIRPGIPNAIYELSAAGINIWMLSGDSEETTLSTSSAVGLLPEGLSIIPLKGLSLESDCKVELMQQVRTHILGETGSFIVSRQASLMSEEGLTPWEPLSARETPRSPTIQRLNGFQHRRLESMDLRPHTNTIEEYAVVMDGTSFSTALREPDTRELLATLLCCATSVICFSMFPHQKALLVRLVKENFTSRPVTLAIGDAENDIPMLQTAEIGIAVETKSNTKVVHSCEVKVSSPSSLPSLLAAGFLIRERLTQALVEWVYVVVLPMGLGLWYTYICHYSGTEVTRMSLWVLYAVENATLILIQSLFGFELPETSLSTLKEIYPQRKSLGRRLVRAVVTGMVHSAVIFGFTMLAAKGVSDSETGFTESFEAIGGSVFLAASWTVLLHITFTSMQTPLVIVYATVVLAGLSVYGIFHVFLGTMDESGFEAIFTSPGFLLSEFGSVLACLILSYLERMYRSLFHPGREEQITSGSVFPETAVLDKAEHLKRIANLYRDSSFWLQQQENSGYEIHPFWLEFHSTVIEQEFLKIAQTFTKRRQQVCFFAAFMMIYLVYEMAARTFAVNRMLFYLLSTVLAVVLGFLPVSQRYTFFGLMLITTGKLVVELLARELDSSSYIYPALYALAYTLTWKRHAVLMCWNFVTVVISIVLYEDGNGNLERSYHIAALVAISVLYYISLVVFVYLTESARRKEFRLMKLTENNLERSKDILSCLFPSFVKEQVVKGQIPVVMEESLVTILFIDICDFDVICSMHSPKGLTSVLDDLSKKLDDMCDSHGLAKIETVGKTFLACAGLIEQETELPDEMARVPPVRRAINMALEVMHTFQFITLRHGPLQVNIGINSGPVIAGVVGFHKPQFALIGDTVNTASRMSSTAPAPCSIQITQSSYDLLGNFKIGLKIEPRVVEVKGKGSMNTYLVTDYDELATNARRGRSGSILLGSSFYVSQLATRHRRDSRVNLLAKLGYWNFRELFLRKDTEVVHAVKWMVRLKSDTPKQVHFRKTTMIKHANLILVGMLLLTAAYSIQTILWFVEEATDGQYVATWALCLNIAMSLSLLLSLKWILLTRLFEWLLILVAVSLAISVSMSIDVEDRGHEMSILALLVFLIVYVIAFGGLFFRHALILLVALAVFWLCSFYIDGERGSRAGIGLALLPIIFMCLSFVYSRETHLRIYTNLEHAAEKEISRTEKLLMQMMPVHVYESLLQEERITDQLKGVTLLFADIVGFTALSSRKTPNEMVHLLSNLFTRFDRLCVKNHVYKVHTIGDCYVAMGYTGRQGRDFEEECLNIASQACDMLGMIKDINAELPDVNLNMRIGVHTSTGIVTAGITGAKIVRYDIYGPDVLVANKMESNGVPGEILISDSTKEILERVAPDIYTFQEKGLIEVPSVKRKHLAYFLRPLSDKSPD